MTYLISHCLARITPILFCGTLVSLPVLAQTPNPESMSISEANRALREAMLQETSVQKWRQGSRFRITESGIEISFRASVVQYAFRDTSNPRIEASGVFSAWHGFRVNLVGKDLVGKDSAEQSCCYWTQEQRAVAERFVVAFKVLAMGVPPETASEAEAFKAIVDQYRTAAPKPEFPEEARRTRVQAESALRVKRLDDAIDRYEEALKIAPWWPEGRFNRALILGDLGRYTEAMREMKRYLALAPDAPNARAAQDKIYEWEDEIKR